MPTFLPPAFRPTGTEPFVLRDGTKVNVPKATPMFPKWAGREVVDTFGGKPVLEFEGKPCFAELVILRTFLGAGWSGRWVETYGAPKMNPRMLTDWNSYGLKAQAHQAIVDASVAGILASIAKENGQTFSGCWDVIVWRGTQLKFVESKLRKHDKLRDTQKRWFAAGVAAGLSPESFLVIEWDSVVPAN